MPVAASRYGEDKGTKLTLRALSLRLIRQVDNCSVRPNDSRSEPNPSFTVRMKSGISQTEGARHRHSLFSVYRFQLWRLKMV